MRDRERPFSAETARLDFRLASSLSQSRPRLDSVDRARQKISGSVASLPSRDTDSYYSGASTTRSDATLCVDDPSAICPSMRMSENDRKVTHQLRDGSILEILEKANQGGKSVSLTLKSGEQIFLERSTTGHSLMMLDRKHRVVHAIGTDWKEPECIYKA